MKSQVGIFIILLISLIFFQRCSKDNPTEPKSSISKFKYGEKNTYRVESTPYSFVHDSATGVTLSFPEGGSGNVSISKIKSSPTVPVEGSGVKIEYSGDTPIELVVDTSDGNSVAVLEYGAFMGCFDDEIGGGERWLEVPRNEVNGSNIAHTLMMPFDLSKSSSGKKLGSNNFWIARLKPSADKTEQKVAVELQVLSFYKQFLATLPTSLKNIVVSRRDRRFLKFAFVDNSPLYTGFWLRVFGKGLTFLPTLHIPLPPKNQTVAHETGHYFIHLLVGDAAQSTLEGEANLFSGHGVLDEVGRDVILEDLAYFMEYFLTGAGADAYNLVEPYDMLKGKSPQKNDFPSYEGFAAHFLAQLVRTNPTIREFSDGSKFRKISLIKLTYGQVFEIISKGATGINELRTNIEDYLGKRANRLPVIAHRIGWRYSVEGKLVDPKGSPVGNAIIKPIKVVDGVTYQGKLEGTCFSRKDGTFAITAEAFPGKSILRIIQTTGDSTDVPIEIDWNKLTTEKIDLGTIEVKPIRKIKTIDIRVSYTGTFNETYPDTIYNFNHERTLEGIYNGGDFTISGNTITATTKTTKGVYNQTSNISVSFDDITSPMKVFRFSINNDALDTYVNAIIKESAVGQAVPFSYSHRDKIYQFTYYGNISNYLSSLTHTNTRSEEFTRSDGSTFTADVIYKLISYDSQGSIGITVEFE